MGAVDRGFFTFERVKVMMLLAAMTAGVEGKLLRVRVLLRPGVLVKVAKLELLTKAEASSVGNISTIVSW